MSIRSMLVRIKIMPEMKIIEKKNPVYIIFLVMIVQKCSLGCLLHFHAGMLLVNRTK